MDIRNEQAGKGTSSSTRGWYASAITCVLLVLMVTPFAPAMPFEGLDGSWSYAMNVATADGLRFGRDIVFTFGPLASIYTTMYHPATDAMMLLGSLIIAAALFAGFFVSVPPQRRGWMLLLPLVLSLGWSRDVVLLFLPVLLPCVVASGNARGRPHTAIVALLVTAMAMLPLIKGNLGLMVAVASGAAVLLSWKSSPRTTALILGLPLAMIPLAWLAVGQSLVDLPVYFIAQLPIISGYTDAMSVPGSTGDIFVYLIGAALLLLISVSPGLRRYWHVTLPLAAYLFVAFKSGFVRHDQHALVAAVALALVGLFLFLTRSGKLAPVALVVGMIGWGLITSTYLPVTWESTTARLSQMIRQPVTGLAKRLTQPGVLEGQYRAISAKFGQRPPFSGFKGTADVYPVDIAPLVAAGSKWSPRPILQSYSAYTPSLLTLNAEHLIKSPPSRVYFTVDPVDHRYPSLDDGVSWLSLLGGFTPDRLDGGYAILKPSSPASVLTPVSPVLTEGTLGDEIAVPRWGQPVWVSMNIQPTLIGRMLSAVYKAPKLSIRVRYENGETADYRMVAGAARTGFLLSPTISDAREFVALGSRYRSDLLDKRRVVALSVYGDSGTRYLWNMRYPISFSGLELPASDHAAEVLTGVRTASSPLATYDNGGVCNIDDVDGRPVTGSAMDLAAGLVTIRGWAAADGALGKASAETWLLVTGRDQQTYRIPTVRVARTDVAGYFKRPALQFAGFEAYVDVRSLPDAAQIRVMQKIGSRFLVCEPAMLTIQRTDQVAPGAS